MIGLFISDWKIFRYNHLNQKDIVYFATHTLTCRWPSAAGDCEMWTAHYNLCSHPREQKQHQQWTLMRHVGVLSAATVFVKGEYNMHMKKKETVIKWCPHSGEKEWGHHKIWKESFYNADIYRKMYSNEFSQLSHQEQWWKNMKTTLLLLLALETTGYQSGSLCQDNLRKLQKMSHFDPKRPKSDERKSVGIQVNPKWARSAAIQLYQCQINTQHNLAEGQKPALNTDPGNSSISRSQDES